MSTTTPADILAPAVPVGAVFVHDGRRFTVTRQHQAPKGRALIGYRSDRGHGMQELADTDRLHVVELPDVPMHSAFGIAAPAPIIEEVPVPARTPDPVEDITEPHQLLAVTVNIPGPLRDHLRDSGLADGQDRHGYGPAGDELFLAITTATARKAGKGTTYPITVTPAAVAVAVDYADTIIAVSADADADDHFAQVEAAACRRFLSRVQR